MLEALLALAIFATLLFSIINFVWALFSKKQKKKRRLYGFFGVVVFVVSIISFQNLQNKSAREAGFVDATDQTAAKTAGFVDAAVWSKQKAAIAEAAAAKESAEVERQKAAQEEEERQARIEDQRKVEMCLSDLKCIWENQRIDIVVACKIAVQSLAKWDYEWTDGITVPSFRPAGWNKKGEGTIMAMGSTLKFQNGFGAWKHVSYLCAYDPKTKTATDAAVF